MSLLCPRKISSSSNNTSHKEEGIVLSDALVCPDNTDRTVREWVQLAEQKGKHNSQTQGKVELGQHAELLRKLIGGWGIFLLSPQNEKYFFPTQ